jgi:endonuclease-8
MEGPSLVILTEELARFNGETILAVEGNTKIGKELLVGQKILQVASWGKHLILAFESFSIRIHFLMFGSYRINERKVGIPPRLTLFFENDEVTFYSCSIKFIEADLNAIYNWKIDIMSDQWEEKLVFKKVKSLPEHFVCDVLLSQDVFAGVGNIIKNEVLFNIRLHPLTLVKNTPAKILKQLVKEARTYSHNFYTWKKIYELKKHWLIYRKRICPRCSIPIEIKKTGKGQRKSFFCPNCQVLFENE